MNKNLLLTIAFGFSAALSANAAWEEMQMKKYTDLQENPIELYFTPETDGLLIISKWEGYSDPYLWTSEACDESSYVPAISDKKGWEGETIYYMGLTAGTTYYSKAPLNEYDNIIAIEYTWEPASDENLKTITFGEPFSNYNPDYTGGADQEQYLVYKFTAEETGYISVLVNPYIWLMAGDTWSFLYTDMNHFNYVPVLNVAGEQSSKGCTYYFKVTEGETYYFYQNYSSDAKFTFSYAEASEIPLRLLNILPAPGQAFDPVNFIGGAQMFFTPTIVSFSKITFDYTKADGTEVSKNVNYEYYSDALMLNIYSLFNEAMEVVEPESKCTITLYDINFDGMPLTTSDVENVTFADGNLSFQYIFSKPIQLTNATWPKTIYAYWPEGEKAGLATLEFNMNVSTVGKILMVMGRQYYNSAPGGDDADQTPSFEISKYTVDEKTLTIDFTGVNRSVEGYDQVTIFVNGITGENGLELEFPMDAYDGSIPVIMNWLPYVNAEYESDGDSDDSGIENISSENTVFNVYNMLGAKVMTSYDKSQLRNLVPGIYIINGKKTVIK